MRHVPRRATLAALATTLLILALLAGLAPADARGQEAPTASSDSVAVADTVPEVPGTAAEADAIRDTLQRPPARYSADWVDVVEFPLKVIGWPLDLVLVRFPAWLVGELTAPRPPSGLVRPRHWSSSSIATTRSTYTPRCRGACRNATGRGSS
jgi:hypothetical protein